MYKDFLVWLVEAMEMSGRFLFPKYTNGPSNVEVEYAKDGPDERCMLQ